MTEDVEGRKEGEKNKKRVKEGEEGRGGGMMESVSLTCHCQWRNF